MARIIIWNLREYKRRDSRTLTGKTKGQKPAKQKLTEEMNEINVIVGMADLSKNFRSSLTTFSLQRLEIYLIT